MHMMKLQEAALSLYEVPFEYWEWEEKVEQLKLVHFGMAFVFVGVGGGIGFFILICELCIHKYFKK